jgi:transposase-like protein
MAGRQSDKQSLVQCRIEACQTIDEIAKRLDVPLAEAMRQLAGDTGVPFNTLKFWYYRDDESSMNTPPPQVPKTTAKTKSKVAAKIVDNINKALDKDEDDAMATSQGKAAKELADGLGGAVLAEELYELFLNSVSKMDEIIKANKELAEPVGSDKIIDQLLRLSRNIGWTEPVVEEIESNTCNKCKVSSCSNRTCDNYRGPVKKKKVKAKLPLRLPKKEKGKKK